MIKTIYYKKTYNTGLNFQYYLLLCLVWAVFVQIGRAQQIRSEVVFHTEKLPREERDYLHEVNLQLAQLINTHNWIERSYRYELPQRIEIIFEKYSRSISYHGYGSGIMVAIRSGLQLRDNRWDFRYTRDMRLHIGDPYDPFTSLIEFYTWICFGFEYDRLKPLGGEVYYEKARLIAENARFEIQYSYGWSERRNFIRELKNERFRSIRTAAFHAEAGSYYMEKGDNETALSHLTRASGLIISSSEDILDLRLNDHIIRFINPQSFEKTIIEVGAEDIMNKLIEWDVDRKYFDIEE